MRNVIFQRPVALVDLICRGGLEGARTMHTAIERNHDMPSTATPPPCDPASVAETAANAQMYC
jgi:hypothetical protein